ncbi:YppE family protein [Listeria ilorinensis]|uniref:YppE family protein n=1 Tax=Listeria ilorinensis TaxID=2867439 RepID=UPI001EF5D662|nr:YppE family protein [Listeria ilorinensis]
MTNLKKWTQWMLEQNEANFARYEKNRVEQEVFDFYKDMKPFVDEAKRIADGFLEEALPFIQKERPRYIGELQLRQAAENLQMTAVSAFNGKSFYKHFLDHYESTKYTVTRLQTAIMQSEEKT